MAHSLRPTWALRFVDCAARALPAVEEAMPEVVIVDVGLPGDDGFTVVQALAAQAPACRRC